MFYFRLAAHLGMTVRELLSRIDSRELSEWMAYYHDEPFGEERADYRSALVACVMANAWSKKHYKLGDFLLEFGPPRQQSMEEMKKVLRQLTQDNRGTIIGRSNP